MWRGRVSRETLQHNQGVDDVSTTDNLPLLRLDDAVKRAEIMQRIRKQVGGNTPFSTCEEFVLKIARLRLPKVYVAPLLNEIERRLNGYRAWRLYENQTLNLRVNDAGDGTVYRGVDLEAALATDPTDEGGVREFYPTESLFEHMVTGPRDVGVYVTPWHEHAPDARCCYVVSGDPTDQIIGCEADARAGDEKANAEYLLEYLKAGLVSLDKVREIASAVADFREPMNVAWPDAIRADICIDGAGNLYAINDTTPIKVCPFTYPTADIVDESGAFRGRQVTFWTGESWEALSVSAKHLESEGSAMFQELGDAGLVVGSEQIARAAFREIVKSPPVRQRLTQYSRPGWHQDKTRRLFVLPTGVAVDADGRQPALVAKEAATEDRETGGSFEAWWAGVGSQIWTGQTPQFAVGLLGGEVGVITTLLRAAHPVLHFSGPPASGKSTAQAILAGLTANPAPKMGTLIELQEDMDGVLPKGVGTCASIDDPTKHGNPNRVEPLMYRAMSSAPLSVSSVASLEEIVERAGSKMGEGIRRRVIVVSTRNMPRIDPTGPRASSRPRSTTTGT
jgi:hypothetical protein